MGSGEPAEIRHFLQSEAQTHPLPRHGELCIKTSKGKTRGSQITAERALRRKPLIGIEEATTLHTRPLQSWSFPVIVMRMRAVPLRCHARK